MKKVCEDCTHNRYCGGEYVDDKGCFYKHYYNKDEKYVMSAEKKEEKEMGIMFDHYIKNVEAIDVEFLPDESQIKLQVRSGENIHLFLLEGEGIKIAAENYVNMEYASLLEKYKEQEAKIELIKKERDELKAAINDIRASNKELERIHENFIEKNRYLLHKLGVKEAAYQTLKKEFNGLSKSLGAKSCEQCDKFKTLAEVNKNLKKRNKELNQQIDEMVLNVNKGKEEDAKLDGVVKALDKALDSFSERMDKLIKEFGDIFCVGELEITTEETYEVKEADEEPHSRRDILRCAEKCVCGKREQDYGTPESNFKLIADLWNDYLKKEQSSVVVDALDVAMMMALLKIARIRNGGGTGDSFVDLAGYAACGGEINAQKKTTETN